MTWEQKLEATQALVGCYDVSLRMRKPGDWYVEVTGRYLGGDGLLRGMSGNGTTPEEAVNDDWVKFTAIRDDQYIVLNQGKTTRRHVRWNGYMWQELPVEAQ
jgi:hypothetical protein